MSDNSIDAATQVIADQIATMLGETEEHPRFQIARIVQVCGVAFAEKMVRRTFETEENGGLMVVDGSRRRTVGGVFFYHVKGYLRSRRRKKKWRLRIVEMADVFPDLATLVEEEQKKFEERQARRAQEQPAQNESSSAPAEQ
ncbi:MAG: hypothetical protein GYB68_02750 [Chloroflexi bacterium]|nr:hypothetical protein [Chloroflexota bacterium]